LHAAAFVLTAYRCSRSNIKTSGKGAREGALSLVLQLVLEAQH
jgi:hypothetical protein